MVKWLLDSPDIVIHKDTSNYRVPLKSRRTVCGLIVPTRYASYQWYYVNCEKCFKVTE